MTELAILQRSFREIRHLRPEHNRISPANRGYDLEILYGLGLIGELSGDDMPDTEDLKS